MIAKFFNNTKPISSLMIILLLMGFLVGNQFLTSQIIGDVNSYIELVKKIGLFFVLLFLVKSILSKSKLTKNNSFGMLFFVLLLMLFPKISNLNNVTYASFFMFLSYRKIYNMQNHSSVKERLFDSSFWIGIATLFYSGSFLMMILVFASLLIFNKVTFKNLLIPFIGFGTPILWIIAIRYFLDIHFFNKITWSFAYSLNFFNNFYISKTIITLMIIIALGCISIMSISAKASFVGNRAKSLWQLLVIHFFITITMFFLYPVKDNERLFMLFFPVSILMAKYLERISKKWIKESILMVFILFVVMANLIT